MAKKIAVEKGKSKVKRSPTFRGFRHAEAYGRRIEKLIEKFPIESDTREWTKFVQGLSAQVQLLERDVKAAASGSDADPDKG